MQSVTVHSAVRHSLIVGLAHCDIRSLVLVYGFACVLGLWLGLGRVSTFGSQRRSRERRRLGRVSGWVALERSSRAAGLVEYVVLGRNECRPRAAAVG